MKTIDLGQEQLTIDELLAYAQYDAVVIRSREGTEFVLEAADDFEREVTQLGQSKAFMEFLAERTREPAKLTLEDIEERLAAQDG